MIIGARRMLDMVSDYGKPTFCSYNYPEIAAYMQLHTEYRHFAVLFSGDIGFYSGAARLRQCLEGMPFQIRSYSGIASPIHFLNRIGKTWEDVHLISCHGQTTPIIANVRSHPKTLALLGKPDDAANICQALTACGLHHTDIYIGAALQQPEELILQGKPADFISQNLPALSVIYIENPAAKDWPVTQGLSDDAFIRGKVPMTKSEVRSVVLSKLALTNTSVLYDIGAGTGSVAIEAARQMSGGHVYAIEKNPDGIALIRDNSRRLLVDNLSVIEGIAPECMSGLPPATHAFIGGTSGHLNDILQLLHKKNPRMHVVITAITLETLAEIVQLVKAASIPEPEIVQIQVSSSKKAGSYHLMQGQNPVYIISFQFL
jgi:precorrin-6Y C5,15-methyltransferase (decarboxylating)